MTDYGGMIKAVFVFFIGLIVLSILSPALRDATRDVAAEDPTGTANKTLEAANSIPDPKGKAKETAGGFLLWLLEEHPKAFILLVFITAGVLIYFGVNAKQLLNF